MKKYFKKIVVAILMAEAKLVIKKYKPKIMAVTGSVGKTSTKDALYTALLPFYHVRKSQKSYNSDIGIPLTILGVPNAWGDFRKWAKNIWDGLMLIVKRKEYPSFLVLEIGADRPGEIERVTKWLKPDVSVITRIGKVPVHVEFYKSVADVVREKSHLARNAKKEGALILNADDDDVLGFKEFSQAKVITYAIDSKADVVASYIHITHDVEGRPTGMTMRVDIAGSSLPVSLPGVLGKQHLYPVLAAFAAAYSQNLNLVEVSQSFARHEAPPGRMNIIKGMGGTTIIDDTYNASPVALEEALNLLGEVMCTGKKIAVLGDMLELGKFSQGEHRRLGAIAAQKVDTLVCVGIRAKDFAEGAHEAGMRKNKIFMRDDALAGAACVKTLMKKGDVIYVKGSQGMRMERTVEELMLDPTLKEKLLVRQDPEWKNR